MEGKTTGNQMPGSLAKPNETRTRYRYQMERKIDKQKVISKNAIVVSKFSNLFFILII